MKSAAPSTPYGYTIFCDDVRAEAGSKASYMGIYRGKLITNAPLPVNLAKFATVVHYFERPGESTEPVALHVFLPGDSDDSPTLKTELPIDRARSQPPKPATPDADPLIGVVMIVEFTPLKLETEGLIRVRAYRGDLEIRLSTLSVVGPPEDAGPTEKAKPAAKKPRSKKSAPRKRARSKKS